MPKQPYHKKQYYSLTEFLEHSKYSYTKDKKTILGEDIGIFSQIKQLKYESFVIWPIKPLISSGSEKHNQNNRGF